MNLICLIISVILFVFVGFKATPDALDSVDLMGFGLAFFAASFFPYGNWPSRP